MDLVTYQEEAGKTAQYSDKAYLEYSVIEESGEVCGCFSRLYREGVREDDVLKEAGDVLWSLAMICHEMKRQLPEAKYRNFPKPKAKRERVAKWLSRLAGMVSESLESNELSITNISVMISYLEYITGHSIEEIADYNIAKLRERQAKGVITGRGDDREKHIPSV